MFSHHSDAGKTFNAHSERRKTIFGLSWADIAAVKRVLLLHYSLTDASLVFLHINL